MTNKKTLVQSPHPHKSLSIAKTHMSFGSITHQAEGNNNNNNNNKIN
jgi:hypothetical protein